MKFLGFDGDCLSSTDSDTEEGHWISGNFDVDLHVLAIRAGDVCCDRRWDNLGSVGDINVIVAWVSYAASSLFASGGSGLVATVYVVDVFSVLLDRSYHVDTVWGGEGAFAVLLYACGVGSWLTFSFFEYRGLGLR
jgi:hypothetical protein